MTASSSEDAPPFEVERPDGRSPYVIVCDHASRRLPRRLGTLGLGEADLGRHIAWDLGIAGVARHLGRLLDAPVILQGHSRLAIDVNRPPGAPDSIVSTSDGTSIPGNLGVSPAEAERRARESFHPYHDRIRRSLDERARAGRSSLLIALHSFTPSLGGRARIWHVGVLYHHEAPLARHVLALLRGQPGLEVGDNEPYAASEATDYTITTHGHARGLPYVELELRQDLIADEEDQEAWAARLATIFERAYAERAHERREMFPA